MGIYIKGIKKPKHCYECTVGECRVRLPKGDINYNVHPQCPLIEVKEPHGRLVDTTTAYQDTMIYGEHFRKSVLKIIDNLPTIIEAEGEQ